MLVLGWKPASPMDGNIISYLRFYFLRIPAFSYDWQVRWMYRMIQKNNADNWLLTQKCARIWFSSQYLMNFLYDQHFMACILGLCEGLCWPWEESSSECTWGGMHSQVTVVPICNTQPTAFAGRGDEKHGAVQVAGEQQRRTASKPQQ